MAKPKQDELIESIEHHADEHHAPSVLSGDAKMVVLTWVTFFLLLAVLYKFAFKPILNALDEREKHIQQSVDDADKIRAEMESLAAKQEQMIKEAQEKAKKIIDESRHAAHEAAKHIQEKAREEAQIILENTKREIHEEAERVQANLREESATIAVELAGRIIEDNLTKEKSKKIIDGYIKEL